MLCVNASKIISERINSVGYFLVRALVRIFKCQWDSPCRLSVGILAVEFIQQRRKSMVYISTTLGYDYHLNFPCWENGGFFT